MFLDSCRRDFTFNALYYTSVHFDHLSNKKKPGRSESAVSCLGEIDWKQLAKDGAFFVDDVLIIQSRDLIAKSFPQGQLDKDFVFSLLKLFSPDHQTADLHVLLDPQCGLQDLVAQKIVCVGRPDERIQEDALRILRALRFAVTLNDAKEGQLYSKFDFVAETRNSLKKFYFLLSKIAPERVRQEIMKAAESRYFW